MVAVAVGHQHRCNGPAARWPRRWPRDAASEIGSGVDHDYLSGRLQQPGVGARPGEGAGVGCQDTLDPNAHQGISTGTRDPSAATVGVTGSCRARARRLSIACSIVVNLASHRTMSQGGQDHRPLLGLMGAEGGGRGDEGRLLELVGGERQRQRRRNGAR